MLHADPTDPRPRAVYVSLAPLAGRRLRNPAFRALQHHGLIDTTLTYNDWLESLRTDGPDGLTLADPRGDATPAGRFRAGLTEYVTADPGRERALWRDLRVRCEALGLAPPPGVAGLDHYAPMLDSPWRPVEAPDAAALQVVALRGEPGTGAMTSHRTACVDLADSGPATHRRRRGRRRAGWPRVAGYR
jgi:hypothetical protein